MTFQYGGRKQQKRRSLFMWFGLLILAVYFMTTLYSAYKLLESTGENQKEQFRQVVRKSTEKVEVEVWGTTAIGLYFWEHIMEGNLESEEGELISFGSKSFDDLKFNFRTGQGVIPETVPKDAQHVVLILNARDEIKVRFAQMWLKSLLLLPKLKKVAVMLLGNEQCNNNWLLPYMEKQGGLVNVAYIVYDIPSQDDTIVQWPLGVATYRNFPKVVPSKDDISSHRPFLCNFLGTVYPNSSRETLQKIFYKHKLYLFCYIKLREKWLSHESKDSAEEYYQALIHSDLTLCPVGMNTECYRIYEACSYGSVPVIEDIRTPGNCSDTPLKLLKHYNAPFIYVKSWTELPGIIEKEKLLTLEQKIKRRERLLEWYRNFKRKLKQSFIAQLKKTFS